MNNVGVCFASTGGKKIIRAVRSFQIAEPDYPAHVIFDTNAKSWLDSDRLAPQQLERMEVPTRGFPNRAHINGILNAAMFWMAELGYSHVCLFHDDIIFSPFARDIGHVSRWFTPELLASSGITFGHFEAFKSNSPDGEVYARRPPSEWDAIDVDSPSLWTQLIDGLHYENGTPIHLSGYDFWVRYEGPDIVRKWNRLGPTGQVVPVATWEQLGGFDETRFVHYDQDYTSECFRRGLPPVWAVPNLPWLHLHNQTMAPWGDPAPEPWGRQEAYAAKFGADWPGFWRGDWEERWKGELTLDRIESAHP